MGYEALQVAEIKILAVRLKTILSILLAEGTVLVAPISSVKPAPSSSKHEN
jgi:hypothetical protein